MSPARLPSYVQTREPQAADGPYFRHGHG
jgi:hypothetical protein